MKHLETYLQRADAFLQAEKKRRQDGQTDNLFNDKGEIIGEYPAFAASFGATVLRSGLLPAVFLYAEKSGGGKSKKPLTRMMMHMIADQAEAAETDLHTYVLAQHEKQGSRLRRRVLDASIAAKLALRTYPVANKTKSS